MEGQVVAGVHYRHVLVQSCLVGSRNIWSLVFFNVPHALTHVCVATAMLRIHVDMRSHDSDLRMARLLGVIQHHVSVADIHPRGA